MTFFVFQVFPHAITRSLKSEFYGKKFSILSETSPKDLVELIHSNPTKHDSIIDHMRDLIQKFVDKGLLEFTYVHHLLWEYTKEVLGLTPRMDELVKQLCDSVTKLATTKPGTRVCCMLASHSGAKERKRMLKVPKPVCFPTFPLFLILIFYILSFFVCLCFFKSLSLFFLSSFLFFYISTFLFISSFLSFFFLFFLRPFFLPLFSFYFFLLLIFRHSKAMLWRLYRIHPRIYCLCASLM